MEGLIIRERILGKDNIELLDPIQELAEGYSCCENGFDVGIGLYCHAMDISQRCNQSIDQSISISVAMNAAFFFNAAVFFSM